MKTMKTEIEHYKNLSDWLLSGSRQMTKREFCYILTLENVGLLEAVRYFNVLRAFLQEPMEMDKISAVACLVYRLALHKYRIEN